MYGESKNGTTVAGVEMTPTAAGYAVDITPHFPLTDHRMFSDVTSPVRVRTLLDTDGDSVSDHVVTTPLKFLDVDGNGVIEPGDRLVLEPSHAEVIQPGTPLDFGPEERAVVCGRIVAQLSGAGRSYPASLMDRR